MLIIGNSNMASPFFHELKKQASFFLKEKIKTARLALTDVTPAQLLTEEAINENPRVPDTRVMGLISRAAFEIDDYWRIVEILHKRFSKYDKKYWREQYHALILLEHLLTHGPESIATEFQSDRDVIRQMDSFQYIDEKGFNWGLTVRKKSERILELLEKGEVYKEERSRARKLTRGIEGFGSFSHMSSSSASKDKSLGSFGRCNSNYDGYTQEEDAFSSIKQGGSIDRNELANTVQTDKTQNLNPKENEPEAQLPKSTNDMVRQPLRENMSHGKSLINGSNLNPISVKENLYEELREEDPSRELKPLLGSPKDKLKADSSMEEDHPFNNWEHQSAASLLSVN